MEEKRSPLRSAVAGVLIVAMLVAVPFVLLNDDGPGDGGRTLPDTAFLYFDGVTLSLSDDGGIQAFVDVYVRPTEDCNNTFMYTFYLKFNDSLWHPSDYETNETAGKIECFKYNEELLEVRDSNGIVVPVDFFSVTTQIGQVGSSGDQDGESGSTAIPNMLYTELSINRDKLIEHNYFEENSGYTVSGSVKQGAAVGEDDYDEGEGDFSEEHFYYLESEDSSNPYIKLGTLSFRVADHRDATTTDIETDDREVLRKLTENWDGGFYYWYGQDGQAFKPTINDPDSDGKDNLKDDDSTNDPPLFVDESATTDPILGTKEYTYPWGIGHYTMKTESYKHPVTEEVFETLIYSVETEKIPADAAAIVDYEFGSELITAKPLREDVTINAYQAYTYEGPGYTGSQVDLAKYNLAIALQKYAPTVEASYVDSRVENFTLNWGVANGVKNGYNYEHDYTIYQRVADDEANDYIAGSTPLPDGVILRDIDGDGGIDSAWQDITKIDGYAYDPTHGEYIAAQYLYYTTESSGGTTEILRYPTPMEVHLTVTPVKVTSVSGEPLDRVYTQSVAVSMQSVDGLQLPDDIRLNTDVVSGAPSLHLEVGSELPTWYPSDFADLKNEEGTSWHPVGSTDEVTPGTYAFTLGELEASAGETDVGDKDNRKISAVYGAEISAKYPWLTVDEYYDIEATRTVLSKDSTVPIDYTVRYIDTDAKDYQDIEPNYTDDDLTLILSVTRVGGDTEGGTETGGTGSEAAFNPGTTEFRIRLPDGTEIDTSKLIDEAIADYEVVYDAEDKAFTLSIKPGITSMAAEGETEDALAHRETVRRWINLGGYYGVSICGNAYVVENDTELVKVSEENRVWTEFYQVYVEPRDNFYEEDKTYNFIGLNVGLIDYIGSFGDTVTLPQGEYRPVIVDSSEGTPNTLSATTESYGVMTTYDALTGAQPGRVYSFRVVDYNDKQVWLTDRTERAAGATYSTGKDTEIVNVHDRFDFATITRYNADVDGANIYDDMVHEGFGAVTNPVGATDDRRPYEPVIRVEEVSTPTMPLESVRLVYEGDPAPNNIITSASADGRYNEVTRVVFDAATVGYTVRQSFTLTIINDGETDINGLYIDEEIDLLGAATDSEYLIDGGGAHFEITDKPASFLPAGAKTTFTVTYTFNLPVLKVSAGTVQETANYLDKIYVCSSAHGPGELADFDATFRVEENEVNRVTVVVLPPFADTSTADQNDVFYLGEAGVISGLIGGEMVYTYDSTMRMSGTQVYIGTFPYDEYYVKDVYTSDSNTSISKNDTYGDVWNFEMPGHSLTVYVVFAESVNSKLRPEQLNVYAASTEELAADRNMRDSTRKTLWQKSFTADELSSATTDAGSDNEKLDDLKLMELGSASASGYSASVNHYLVVLEADEEYVQSDVILREVKALYTKEMLDAAKTAASSGSATGDVTYDALVAAGYPNVNSYLNENIENVRIVMQVYGMTDDGTCDITNPGTVYDSSIDPDEYGDDLADGYPLDANYGSTADRTKHTSEVFEAPDMGSRKWLVITLSHTDTDAVTGQPGKRSYYIELVRRPSHSVTVNYGNSPAGMIYNTDALVVTKDGAAVITDGERTLNADGVKSLELFRTNRDFSEHTDGLLPYAFRRAGNTLAKEYSYNREAWIPYGQLYDPDSLTYTESYVEANDLDLDPYSLFVTFGEDFVDPGLLEIEDSSMRPVEKERVTRYIRDAVYIAPTDENDAGKGFFELASEDREPQIGRIYLGTLAEDAYISSGYWQATHDYRQEYEYMESTGESYPVFVYTDESGNEEFYVYQPNTGNYFLKNTPNQTIEEEKIPYLKPHLIDYAGGFVALRPGVYDLVYEFDDFDSVENAEPLQVTRKLVVLGPTGDATADGSVTIGDASSDETAIEKRVGTALGYDYDGGFNGSNAFKFRTVDANNDRNVNNIDANELHSNSDKLMQMYEPVYYKDGVVVPTETEVGS